MNDFEDTSMNDEHSGLSVNVIRTLNKILDGWEKERDELLAEIETLRQIIKDGVENTKALLDERDKENAKLKEAAPSWRRRRFRGRT